MSGNYGGELEAAFDGRRSLRRREAVPG